MAPFTPTQPLQKANSLLVNKQVSLTFKSQSSIIGASFDFHPLAINIAAAVNKFANKTLWACKL